MGSSSHGEVDEIFPIQREIASIRINSPVEPRSYPQINILLVILKQYQIGNLVGLSIEQDDPVLPSGDVASDLWRAGQQSLLGSILHGITTYISALFLLKVGMDWIVSP